MFGHRACNQMIRDQERLEEFGAVNRDSFALFNDELYLLFHQKMLNKLSQFLDMSYKLDNIVMTKLERHFKKDYSWIKKHERQKVKSIDSKCGTLYGMSVYSPISENNTLMIKGITYPLRISNYVNK